jgi:hypothetical protein
MLTVSRSVNKQRVAKSPVRDVFKFPFLAGPVNDFGKNPTIFASLRKGSAATKMFSMLLVEKLKLV